MNKKDIARLDKILTNGIKKKPFKQIPLSKLDAALLLSAVTKIDYREKHGD